jgi:hypothetical protein
MGGVVPMFRTLGAFDGDLARYLGQEALGLGGLDRSKKKLTGSGANAIAHLPTM